MFLDRDGVINKGVIIDGKSYPPQTIEDYELLPGVKEGICSLHEAEFKVFVATNQPDVETGKQKIEVVEQMHDYLLSTLPIDEIFVCYHTDSAQCSCRKPKPGMLLEAAEKYGIDLKKSFMVGDRWRDVEAGQAVGCHAFFIDYGYNEKLPKKPYRTVKNLLEAAKIIVTS